eukprot:gene14697-17374_t
MYWTLELASHLEDAPWPATKDELIDYGIRSGAPVEVIENLQALEDDGSENRGLFYFWNEDFAVVLVILWVIGFFFHGFGDVGGLIHILLVIAVIAIILKVINRAA